MSDFIEELLDEEPQALRAARLVAEALKNDSGRRKKHDYWRPVTKPVFGDARISRKMWDKVMEAGERAGLFTVDTKTFDYPILVEGKTLMEVFEEAGMLDEEPPPLRPLPPPEEEPAPEPPTTQRSSPMQFLDCGHFNYQDVPKDPSECNERELARLQLGRGAGQPYKTTRFDSPVDCWKCANKKAPDSYQHQKPGYQTPIPPSMRRGLEKERGLGWPGLGWPGLCADPVTGFYIGGLGNDCRRYHSPEGRCVVHRPSTPSTEE